MGNPHRQQRKLAKEEEASCNQRMHGIRQEKQKMQNSLGFSNDLETLKD